jgi:hypothetical protein
MSKDTVPMAIAVAWRTKKFPELGRVISIRSENTPFFPYVQTIMAFDRSLEHRFRSLSVEGLVPIWEFAL